ncbi:hypothetical protein UFOVP322_32 [uncultured Caudovirales phage]|uniref:Uncharacterized protein n=1 Tax=uncultured Caudovirales phage TaxID=2100421 RepID=A0A6J5LU76_9CAUD|nr:hypothetical protein UFOVP322_32 [uncultured Caudovirales phage]CAB4161017.1 hypothetical protein UFOVP771_30 [uncultured Caudovirales phage]CAB4166432.1 hypothetical protein UFOVP850_30 [uncultured Caudovirales phage]
MKTYHYTHEDMDPRKYKCFFWRGDADIETAKQKIYQELGHRIIEIWEAAE